MIVGPFVALGFFGVMRWTTAKTSTALDELESRFEVVVLQKSQTETSDRIHPDANGELYTYAKAFSNSFFRWGAYAKLNKHSDLYPNAVLKYKELTDGKYYAVVKTNKSNSWRVVNQQFLAGGSDEVRIDSDLLNMCEKVFTNQDATSGPTTADNADDWQKLIKKLGLNPGIKPLRIKEIIKDNDFDTSGMDATAVVVFEYEVTVNKSA